MQKFNAHRVDVHIAHDSGHLKSGCSGCTAYGAFLEITGDLVLRLQSQPLDMSRGDVYYSCGACGYPLNLSSSQRILSCIDSEYHKSIRKGTISFLTIDESRFKQLDEFKCGPYFQNKNSWGIHSLRTRLLCGNCGRVIGHSHGSRGMPYGLDGSDSSSGSGTHARGRFCVKIKALQPSHETDV